jgi:uncharacterized LabA/DUF88 family protein
MEKVLFFLDYANINRSASDKGFELDYEHLMHYISEGRFLIDSYCYVPIDPRIPTRTDRAIEELWSVGYVVNSKIGTIAGDSYKCDFDVEMAMDITKMAHIIKPDIVILGTGDVDFIPLVLQLRKDGIRVEVASFHDSASRELMLRCSGFISLDKYYAEDYMGGEAEQDADENIDHNQDFDYGQDVLDDKD